MSTSRLLLATLNIPLGAGSSTSRSCRIFRELRSVSMEQLSAGREGGEGRGRSEGGGRMKEGGSGD